MTTGIDTIDSFVSSTHLETANASTHYSEPLVQLRDLPVCYYQPDEGAPLDRISMGLAPSARLYGCPQSLFKYHPAFDAVLAGILRADKRAIILGIDGSHPTWGRLLRARLERNMPDVHHRVKFIPHVPNEKFTALLKMMDVLLDPLHFGGGNTSLEGFAAGVPIVTWPGEFMRSRVTVGAYRQMGFTDLVVDGAQRYVDTAIKVANDKPYRAQCIEAIRAGAPRLINHRPAVTEFAQYLRSAYAGR